MQQTFKNRLVGSTSRLILAVLATATMALAASPAVAQDAKPDQATPTPNAAQTTPPSTTGNTTEPPTNPVGAATGTTPDAEQTEKALGTAQVGDVIVTARLKSENIQKVPETIVAITPETLKNNNITNFYQLQGFAPSVDIYPNYGKDYTSVLIRGFGTSTLFSEIPGLPSSFYDISNVQILYGPQGTLFGYTALGGAVLYTPTHPQLDRFAAGADVTVGNLNTLNASGYVNIPIVKDRLALRIAAGRVHTDGYIQVLNRSDKLDSLNEESIRIGLEYKSPGGRFTDYTLFQANYQHSTATAQEVTFYNPLGYWNSQDATGAGFAYLCTPAILAQVWSAGTTQAQCQAQHAAVLKTFQQQAATAIALTKASHGSQILPPIENVPLEDPIHTNILLNILNWDAIKWHGALGGGSISFHNIGDITWYKNTFANYTVGAFDYYSTGSTQVILPTPRPSLLTPGSVTNPPDGFGAPQQPAFSANYIDEFQIHGTLDDDLGPNPGLTWVVGFYNSIAPRHAYEPRPTSQNIPISFNGAYVANEGPVPSYYYGNTSKTDNFGQYVNVIADAGALYKPLTGVQVNGGIRFNENYFRGTYFGSVTNYTAPDVFSRGPYLPAATYYSRSKPVNYSAGAAYLTKTNNAYFTFAHIIVPGGANGVLQAGITLDQVPGYAPTFAPETLDDYEFGDKWRFNINGVRGYINFAVYYEKFGNVQVTETAFIPTLALYQTYTGNPANEKRKGIEVQGEVFPTSRLDIYANFSYAHDYYTNYLAPDPVPTYIAGYVGPYNPALGNTGNQRYCVPAASAATIPAGSPPGTLGTCIFDFSKSPLPFAPKFQASVRASYTYPLPRTLGDLVGSVTANYISREFFQGGYSNIPLVREQQLLGPAVADAESSPPHTLINLRLQWNKPFGHDNFSAAAYVTNLTDKHYPDGSLDFLFATGVATEDFGPPRQYGLTLSAKF